MCNRIYKFFSENNIIYSLQFGFRQQFHALVSLTEDIMKNSDKGNISCGIFVDLQKAFDTVEHDILLAKSLNTTVFVAWQTIGLNPISLTKNNLFQQMVMYPIKLQ